MIETLVENLTSLKLTLLPYWLNEIAKDISLLSKVFKPLNDLKELTETHRRSHSL